MGMQGEADLLKSSILIVDDDPVFVEVVIRSLKRAGYTNITSLSNPISALELLAELEFDLMLLDQCMPEMSGVEVLQSLSSMSPAKRPAVLMVTGSSQLTLPGQAISLGAWDLLSKPVEANSILLRIRNLLQIKSYQRQLESENQLLLQALDLQKKLKGQQLSLVDRATELPNKMIFFDRLEQALLRGGKQAEGVGILRVEYASDSMEQNYQWMHKVVSELSAIVGHKTMFRNTHYSCLVMLDQLKDQGDVDLVLEKIKSCQGRCFDTVKLGVVLSWGGDKSAGQLLEEAEAELLEQDLEEGTSLKGQLYKAIFEQEGADFELVWQPQITSLSMQLVAAEALLRWRSQAFGDVSPARFIPLAEAEGWIGEISRIVVERSLQQYAYWRDELGIELNHFSINLSANDLQDEGIIGFIEEKLQQYQVPPAAFCVELTESELMTDLTQGQIILRQLKALGVKVALDDFGSGYSSLSYLRLFDVDILKLDRSFILDLTENSASQSIIQALVAMAKVMGIEVVVEGVEDLQQRKALLKCGVDLIQGFFYSRPLSEAAFVEYMKTIPQTPGASVDASMVEVVPMEWSCDLHGVGHDEIDGQHQMLFKIINQLVEAMESGNGQQQLPTILDKMREYAEFHLLSEEIVLNEVQYEWRKEHHESHETIRRGIQQLLDYQSTLHPVQAYQYLRDIWVEHIQREDRAFTHHL